MLIPSAKNGHCWLDVLVNVLIKPLATSKDALKQRSRGLNGGADVMPSLRSTTVSVQGAYLA